MEFRQALKDIVINKKLRLDNDESDRAILQAFSSYCGSNNELLQLQELKNIFATGVRLAQDLERAYTESRNKGDTSFKAIEDVIERIADELEKNNISCFSYAYFIFCYLDLFKDLFHDAAFKDLDLDPVEWIDPEQYDYGYQNMPVAEKTLGFGRYRAAIKDFTIENGILKKYCGHEPYVIVPHFVKRIGARAFADNKKIRSVYTPRAVSEIEAGAFSGCENLETVVLSDNVTYLAGETFEGCRRLKRINLEKITAVGSKCFKGCIMLEKVELPVLTKVGNEAFAYCIGLKDMGFVSNLIQIGCRAFECCTMNYISLDRCEILGDMAFLGCEELSRIALGPRMTQMGLTPFMGCVSVNLLNIADGGCAGDIFGLFADDLYTFNVLMTELRCIKTDTLKNAEFAGYEALREVEVRTSTVVPDRAFEGCGNLTIVKLNADITAIGRSAFAACPSLRKLEMHFVGDEIAERAFYKCGKLALGDWFGRIAVVGDFAFAYTDLSAVDLSRQFRRIGAFAFANALFPPRLSLDLRGCEVLPGAFHGAGEITSLRIDAIDDFYQSSLHLLFDPIVEAFTTRRKINYIFVSGSVTEQAFAGYTNVRYVEFTAMNGKIPGRIFEGCTALESVKVLGAVSVIEPHAFAGCSKLAALEMQYDAVAVGRGAFSGCTNIHSIIDLSRVTRFGEYAFANTDITELILSDGVQFIGKAAFAACPSIREVVLPFVGCMPNAQNDAKYFGAVFGTEPMDGANVQSVAEEESAQAFFVPARIQRVTVLSDTLEADCFAGCDFLTAVELPRVTALTAHAFEGCTGLRSLSLGKDLAAFSGEALLGCAYAVRVDIDPACAAFRSLDGTVVSADGRTLYFLDGSDRFESRVAEIHTVRSFAVPFVAGTLDVPPSIVELEPYAFNCTAAREIRVRSVDRVHENAFYGCDAVKVIDVVATSAYRAFACDGPKLSIERLTIADCRLEAASDLFAGVQSLAIKTLSLKETAVEGASFFNGVSSVETLEIGVGTELAESCLRGLRLSSLSMCGQARTVAALLGAAARMETVIIRDGDIHGMELAGLSVDTLRAENIGSIHAGAFTDCKIGEVLVERVVSIDSRAFKGADIGAFSVDAEAYRMDADILYQNDTLLHCFDQTLERFTLPAFVGRVCSGAFENLKKLRQVSVLHRNVLLEPAIFVGCNQLDTVEIVEVSNRYLRELFDDPIAVRTVRFSGDTVKRKFFAYMDCVREIRLNNVKEIGDLAFYGNARLDSVSGLEAVVRIGDMAFADCPSLKSVVLSQDCRHIGMGVFEGCSALEKVVYPIDSHQTEQSISAAELFGEELSPALSVEIVGGDIPAEYFADFPARISVVCSPVAVGESAFRNSGLVQIDLSCTTDIGNAAFSNSNITSVEMPTVKRIGASAFKNCTALKTVMLSNDVETLGVDWLVGAPVSVLGGAERGVRFQTVDHYLVDRADDTLVYAAPFANATVVIDESVHRIAATAFIGSAAKEIDARAVAVIDAAAFAACSALEDLTVAHLQNGEDAVPLRYFTGDDTRLRRVEVRGGTLADACFADLARLETVVLPLELKAVSKRCFAGCRALREVGNLAAVSEFGEACFADCASLKTLALPFLGRNREEEKPLSYLFGVGASIGLNDLTVSEGELVAGAFDGCTSLVSVSLPKGITHIPAACFKGCAALKIVFNTDRVTCVDGQAFAACTSATVLGFPKLESVGDNAFAHCTALSVLVLPKSLKQIGTGILEGCTALTDLSLSFTDDVKDVAALGKGAAAHLVRATVWGKVLGERAFANCARLEEVTLSDAIKKIAKRAFESCTALHTVIGGNAVTEIGEGAFEGCVALNALDVLEKTARIGRRAFFHSGLSGKIDLPAVREMGEGAFGATPIKQIVLGEGITQLETSVFEECAALSAVQFTEKVKAIAPFAFRGCASLKGVDLSHVKTLGERAFAACTSLMAVDLGAGEQIGVGCFEDCTAITSVQLNEALLVIPELAFAGCKALQAINIPGALTAIGERAFALTAMKKLELKMPPTLTDVGAYVFWDAHSPTVYVANGQTDSWNPDWGSSCKRHGILWSSKKVLTKKYSHGG